MTMTTEAPTWLNLAVLAPEDLRAESAELRSVVIAAREQLTGMSERIIAVLGRTEALYCSARAELETVLDKNAMDGIVDGLGQLVRSVTGATALMTAVDELGELFNAERLELLGERAGVDTPT